MQCNKLRHSELTKLGRVINVLSFNLLLLFVNMAFRSYKEDRQKQRMKIKPRAKNA